MTEPHVSVHQALTVSKEIASETFDDETVLISVERGLYFSLRGSASQIWDMFREPRTIVQVVSAFGLQAGASDAKAVEDTIAEFVANELLVPSAQVAAPVKIGVTAYIPPSFEAFSDLAAMIAIDPVHEVDVEAGWPTLPEGFPRPT